MSDGLELSLTGLKVLKARTTMNGAKQITGRVISCGWRLIKIANILSCNYQKSGPTQ